MVLIGCRHFSNFWPFSVTEFSAAIYLFQFKIDILLLNDNECLRTSSRSGCLVVGVKCGVEFGGRLIGEQLHIACLYCAVLRLLQFITSDLESLPC